MIGAALLAVTMTFSPAQPTVGDRIVLHFDRNPVVLNRDAEFEIVHQDRSQIVIRTFQPKPLALSGYAGGEEFHGLTIPVRSVLLPNDDLKPAPLIPPRAEAEPLLPFILIGVAALTSIAVWAVLWMLVRRARRALIVAPPLSPLALFRERVMRLREAPSWMQLADALRDYLASTSDLSLDLTTTQLLARTAMGAGIGMNGAPASAGDSPAPAPPAQAGAPPAEAGAPSTQARPDPVVARILRQGDLEKFSPWGAAEMNFDEVAERALALVAEMDDEEQAA